MMTANDVRDVRFSKAMGGYKQEEVDNFLDTVEADYKQYEAYVHSMQERVNALNSEIESYKNSQSSLQNVLISAQKLADNIINEAKAKAEKIVSDAKEAADKATAEAKGMLENFDIKLAEKRASAEKELKADLEKAKREQEAVKAVTKESVNQQQALFDKIRLEVGAFKSDLMEQYKKHIEIISKIPDCVAMDANRAAKAVELEFDKQSESDALQHKPEKAQEAEEIHSASRQKEEPAEDIASSSSGFVVNTAAEKSEDLNDDVSGGFSNKFFRRNK